MWYTVCMNNLKLTFAAASVALACTVSVRANAETFSLNTDWRFTKAPKTIPLSQAKSSVETNGVKVEDPAFDDSSWEAVSVPHPINAHDSFDDRAVDAGEASFWRGMAFYRKRFALDAAPKGKAFVTFETVRQSVYLWANGKFAGYYEAGIAPVRAYDKFGIVNAAPAGDKEGDVSGRAWAQRVEAMRDTMIYFRNSPSVVFWEAGNNQISPAHMKEMVELKKLIDPDGFRFMGCRTLQTKEQVAEAEYVGTMLHRHEMPAFDSMKALGKFVPMMETEYARQESPRRSWDDYTPPDYDYRGRYLNGGKKETGFDVYDQTQEDFALSTAKEYAEFYGARASGRGAKTYSAVAALCWTDSNQHGRQSFSENCRSSGRVDAVRLPKVNFDVFRVMQSEDPAVMLVGHWSYPKLTKDNYMYPVKKYNGHFMEETGEMAQRDPLHKTVYAIGSVHCASVELVVNGKSKGVNAKPDDVFVYAFPNVDITESGTAEVIARDKAGKEIARHAIKSFAGEGKVETAVTTGPQGWLADGSDIAVVDFRLVDAKGTVHPFASEKISFELSFKPDSQLSTPNSQLTTPNSPVFMGGWNSGVFGEASPIGKNFINLECGMARVFVKAGRKPGKVTLKWSVANSNQTIKQSKKSNNGVVELELKPFETKGGISAAPQQEYPANARTFARRTSAAAVQDLAASDSAKAVSYAIRVNGAPVAFAKGMGEPVKPDDNTGVCCAYEPVLAALKADAKARVVDLKVAK